ncbi:hypothetical protein PMIN06_011653 [Paraphaeosphaeria minitans]
MSMIQVSLNMIGNRILIDCAASESTSESAGFLGRGGGGQLRECSFTRGSGDGALSADKARLSLCSAASSQQTDRLFAEMGVAATRFAMDFRVLWHGEVGLKLI